MPMIHIPTPLRYYVNGQNNVTVKGVTVGQAFEDLLVQFPALRPHLTRGDGSLRHFVNLFLGEHNLRDLQGLDTPLKMDDCLKLVPSTAGG